MVAIRRVNDDDASAGGDANRQRNGIAQLTEDDAQDWWSPWWLW